PVTLDLAPLAESEPDRATLLKLCAELEFYTLVRRLEGAGASATPRGSSPGADEATPRAGEAPSEAPAEAAAAVAAPALTLTLVDDSAAIPELVTRLRQASLLALAVGTRPVEPHDAPLIGLALATSPHEAWYLPFAHRPPLGELAAPEPVRNLPALTDPQLAPLASLLRDETVPKAGHDLKYAWQVLRGAGVELGGVHYDTMLASFVLDPGRRSHALDTLSLEHLGQALRVYADLAGRGRNEVPFDEVPVAGAADFLAAQATTVLALERYFAPSLGGMGLERLLRDIELPLVRVLVDMEWAGIAIDPALFSRLSGELTRDLAELEAKIARVSGSQLNLNSPKQLATLLFDKLQLPVLKKTKTGPSTDADVLEQLAALGHEVPTLILEYRELQKLKSTYVEVLPQRVNRATGRIHTSFNQTGAATGRLSSSEPNLQNIPVRTPRGEEIRKGFVPGPGQRFVVADYSQIELRLMAHLSEDPAFIAAFRSGGDIHRQTASIIFGVPPEQVTPEMRARAKTINFGTIYGQGPFALARQLNITQDEAKAFITQYFQRFAGVRAYLDLQVKLARNQGYVETLFGRRRYIPEIKDKNFNLRAFAERTAANTPLQGSAADLIKVAMIRIHAALAKERLRARLLLQVHDELVLEAPADEADAAATLVRRHMESAAELTVPLVVDVGIGDNWLDAKH
ncbi:MAG TPA: DNA polymerase I, partial [Gemmatimonadales bacterium]|nr:DNA polymerase I [Gemmatimonadales bacterium]